MVDVNGEIDKLSGLLEVEDITPVKMTIEKALKPELSAAEVHDKYYPEDTDLTSHAKTMRMTRTTKYIKNKYPEIFKPFRDSAIVDMSVMVKDLVEMALCKDNKVGDRVKAHKAILDAAVQAERFSKDKEIDERTLETVAFEDKTYGDIIRETRQKYAEQV